MTRSAVLSPRRKFAGVLVLIGVIFLITGRFNATFAQGGTQERKQSARVSFNAGLKHYNLGEFEDALREFRQAYRIEEDPAMLFNIGQCHFKLGDLDSAVHSFRAYLRSRPDSPKRREIEARIADLEARLEAKKRASPDVQVSSVRPGPPAKGLLVVAPVAPPPSADQQLAARVKPTPDSEPKSVPMYRTWWFWTAAGVVAAGAVGVAIVLGRGDSVPATALGDRDL